MVDKETKPHVHGNDTFDADTCQVCDEVMRRDSDAMLLRMADEWSDDAD